MATTSADVRAVAQLAQLRIEDDAIDDVTERFNRILDLVAELQQIDTQGVEPMSNPHDMEQRLRPDEVTAASVAETIVRPRLRTATPTPRSELCTCDEARR